MSKCGFSCLIVVCFVSASNAAEEEKSWSGVWNNRKYRTKGPLKCTVSSTDGNKWNAKFEGKGIGKPFKYDASFQATKKGSQTVLRGTSMIDGHRYQWMGIIRGKTLYGRYQATNGNNGEFQLTQSR